jgi:hypothetical protein
MGDLTPDLGRKLALLIPRLASDQEGEVVATVQAIRRALARAELDLHDLAARLAAPDPEEEPAPRRKPQPRTKPHHAAPDDDDDVRIDHLIRARWLWNNCRAELTPKEASFVNSAIGILASGHSLSAKQWAWLASLSVKYGYDAGAEAAA